MRYSTDLNNFVGLEPFVYKGWLRMKINFFLAKDVEITENTNATKDSSEIIKIVLFDMDEMLDKITELNPFLLYGVTLLKNI